MCIAWGYHKLKWMEKPFERKKTIRKPIMNFKLKKGERTTKMHKKLVLRRWGEIFISTLDSRKYERYGVSSQSVFEPNKMVYEVTIF